jgi:hypothetical protein
MLTSLGQFAMMGWTLEEVSSAPALIMIVMAMTIGESEPGRGKCRGKDMRQVIEARERGNEVRQEGQRGPER